MSEGVTTTPDQPTDTKPFSRLPAEDQVAQVRDLDRAEVERRTAGGITPTQLWAQWKAYVARQEACDPPEPAIVTEFSLNMGLAMGDLHAYSERGRDYAHVVKKIHHDQVQRIERRLLRGQAIIGAIFWLKNRAGFRDKSAEETAADHEDWLTKLTANRTTTDGLLPSPGRESAPPQPDQEPQTVEGEEDSTGFDTPPRLVMGGR